MKRAVQVAKITADWRLGNDFEGNKKMFWKEVKRMRKSEQARAEMIKVVNGQILRDGKDIRRWAEYFEQVLYVADVREANIIASLVLEDLNERAISFHSQRL